MMSMPKKYKIISEEDGGRLDKTLAALFPELTRSYLQRLIDDEHVTVNGKIAGKKQPVKKEDVIELTVPDAVPITDAMPEDIPLSIAYEDSDLLVVNKAKGMVVHPAAGNYTGTLVNALLNYCGDTLSGINGVQRPGIVHRLDKDTSGLLIVAKNDFTHKALAELIKVHNFTRQYEAILVGTPREYRGTVSAPIARNPSDRKKMAVVPGGREAVTHYEVLDSYRGFSHVRLTLETGRTHQIRVHMAHIGHPVVCDEVYGSRNPQFACCKGQCLHARRIAFKHPRTGELIDITSSLPEYFENILKILKSEESV